MPIIQNSVAFPQHSEWKLALAQSFRSLRELLEFCAIDADPTQFPAMQNFPLRVTRFYASLIERGNINDPLLRQVLPLPDELQEHQGYSADAVGDCAATVAPGLIHKYSTRVLITLTGACAIHCRYCFRRHYPYSDNAPALDIHGTALEYIHSHPELREVVLSGGDPLMLSDEKLEQLITDLNGFSHIRLLRIHSRLASVLPERFAGRLLDILSSFNGVMVLVSHINHPNELGAVNQRCFMDLQQQGIRLLNQSVLLKGVNDDSKVLAQLSYRLYDCGITPYYLHCLDKVQGATHFDLPRDEACAIHTRLQHSLPGYLVPRLVEEIPGQPSKTPVQCERIALSSRQTQ
jgi:EF-P beta-lysylation protein EpmB